MPDLRSFDYIIVGGGTAACVLANRLTEDSSIRVLMIEAGSEPTSPWIKMPLAMGKLFTHPKLNWGLYTAPEAKLNNRTIFWPRGIIPMIVATPPGARHPKACAATVLRPIASKE